MEKTITVARQARGAEVRASSYDEGANTIEVCWTTGASVRRNSWIDGPYDEVLETGAANVRLDRLNAGAPFLNTHDSYDLSDVLGSVVPGTAKMAAGRGLATIQLTRRPDAAGIVQDIRDGVIKNVSVGYRYHKVEKTEADDGTVPIWRVVDWEPLEISAVPIPADPGSQVRADGKEATGANFPCVMIRGDGTSPARLARMRMRTRSVLAGLR